MLHPSINFCPLFWNCKRYFRISVDLLSLIKSNYSSAPISLQELFNKHKNHDLHKKIIYNDVLIKKRDEKTRCEIDSKAAEPIFIKYLSKNEPTVNTDNTEESDEIFFPYEIKTKFLNEPTYDKTITDTIPQTVLDRTPSDDFEETNSTWTLKKLKVDTKNLESPGKWNYLKKEQYYSQDVNLEMVNCDPSVPVSNVPCSGCGAFLHCQDVSIPGFIPKEAFDNKTKQELKKEICQRCLFLREFDVALSVSVSPSEYPEILKQIRKKNSLAIIVVDLLDFPCSYWSGISEIIGFSKPIVIVGNKIDLIKEKDPNFLRHVKKSLLHSLVKEGLDRRNVKYVSLISAKTGFGVNLLIDHLFKNWEYKGDVFLIGCTNVGKSTLFNTLTQSDYCSLKFQNIFQKATVSCWPGTTLKLLKFPITRPALWHVFARQGEIVNEEDISFEKIPFQGYGKSYFLKNSENCDNKITPKAFNPENYNEDIQRWCFDTPGVVKNDQMINLLTTPELLLTLPKAKIIPRNFHMKPGTSLFIGGLARLDYVDGPNLTWFTVFASHELPVTVTNLEDADLVYELLLGSPLFRVPMGGKNRFTKWPKLLAQALEIVGKKKDEADGDVVLSSAGWVAVNTKIGYVCNITAWTPDGRGIYLRNKALIKSGHKDRGERIQKTPAFKLGKENY